VCFGDQGFRALGVFRSRGLGVRAQASVTCVCVASPSISSSAIPRATSSLGSEVGFRV
jgi:hypothetical protein